MPQLNLSISLPSLEIFGALEIAFSYFTSDKVFEYWKILGINEND
jgi:hypothetical protein